MSEMMSWPTPTATDRWDHCATIRPRSYRCHFVDHDWRVDGRLDKPEWLVVPFSDDFVDIEGAEKPPLRTRMKMLWSANFLYVAADLQEPQVWATLKEKNSVIFQDNDFEIFIDPDGDNALYYECELNAFNTIWELTMPRPYKDGGVPLSPYNIAGLQSAVSIQGELNNPAVQDRGWTVELAIPWQGLAPFQRSKSCLPRAGDYWRINFSRVEWHYQRQGQVLVKEPGKTEENWVWSPQGLIDMHRPEMWGYLEFDRQVDQRSAWTDQAALRPYEQTKRLAMELYYQQRQASGAGYLPLSKLKGRLSAACQRAVIDLYLTENGYLAVFNHEGVTLAIDQHARILT